MRFLFALAVTLLSLGTAVFYRDVIAGGKFNRQYIIGQLIGLSLFSIAYLSHWLLMED